MYLKLCKVILYIGKKISAEKACGNITTS